MRWLPRHLWVGDTKWQVKLVRKIPDQPDNTIGLCDPSDHIIYIKMRQGFRQTLVTLFHEVVHAAEYEFGFEVPHSILDKLDVAVVDVALDNEIVNQPGRKGRK